MNKREAALQFIRDNSRALHESNWGDAIIEYRAVNGHAFVLMEHAGNNGWTAFWPTMKNNVDVEMQKFEELSGEKFVYEPEETKKIRDMRGEQFSSNYLTVENDKLYAYGIPVKKLTKPTPHTASLYHSHGRSAYFYYIMVNDNDAIAMIALSDEDYQLAVSYIKK